MPASDFASWVRENPVSPSMYWKEAAESQFEKFRAMGEAIGEPLTVVGHHTSKSIKLPVVAFRVRNGWFVLRDNFYGLNLCCLWDFPPDLALADVYVEKDWAWYKEQIEKKQGYCFKGWTEEEINDPRILRALVTGDDGSTYWSKLKDGDEKDRWLKRWSDTAWYSRDWSSGKLLTGGSLNEDGTFGPGTVFYGASHAFAEGISGIVSHDAQGPYEPGKSRFILDTGGYDRTLALMQRIMEAEQLPE